MTCIVGLVSGDSVFLGADSLAVRGWDKSIRKDPKIYTFGEFTIGFTTSFRMGQILGYSSPPTHPENMGINEYMCTLFVDHCRDVLKTKGFAEINSNREQGGAFLLAYRGRLFRIESDFQVCENACGFDAVGCGDSFALGALHVTPKLDPAKRLYKALQAAEAFCTGVGGPFIFRECPAYTQEN
jgi:hypothetical protein